MVDCHKLYDQFTHNFVNGTVDILPPGHVQTLNDCKAFGDVLTVCISSDLKVQEKKGPTRP